MADFRKMRWDEASVRCPFYLNHGSKEPRICCEGCVEGAELVSRFRSLSLREKHMGLYCAGKFERCPVYRCVYAEKYDD